MSAARRSGPTAAMAAIDVATAPSSPDFHDLPAVSGVRRPTRICRRRSATGWRRPGRPASPSAASSPTCPCRCSSTASASSIEGALGVDGRPSAASWKYRAHYSHGEVKHLQRAREFSRIAAELRASAVQRGVERRADRLRGERRCESPTNDDPACRPLNPFGQLQCLACESLAYVTRHAGHPGAISQARCHRRRAERFDLFSLWAGDDERRDRRRSAVGGAKRIGA
jgi:hypothetical protein